MCVLTADKRLAVILCKEFLNCIYRRIHLAFHITGIIISSVMDNTFVVHKSGRIVLAVEL